MSVLFQVGALPAFLQGVYESPLNFKALSKKGDFGLGVLNALGGEMVAVDGHFFQISPDGDATPVSPEDCTPFSLAIEVTH